MNAADRPGDSVMRVEQRDLFADLAAGWVRRNGTLPPSLKALEDWARHPLELPVEAEIAYLERRGPDPYEAARVEPGSDAKPKISLTNGYFATARRHALKGSELSRWLAACLTNLQRDPMTVDEDDVERLRYVPVLVRGSSPALALWVAPSNAEVVVLRLSPYHP